MKLSFVNAIAAMCEAVGADVDDVDRGHRATTGASATAFLRPGPGLGRQLLPQGLAGAASRSPPTHGYDFTLMRGVIDVNEEQRRRMVDKVRAAAGRRPGAGLRGVTVGVLGLTFKAGTDDLRDSPSVAIVQALLAAGATVQAYDPTVESAPTGAKAAALRGITLVGEPLAAADRRRRARHRSPNGRSSPTSTWRRSTGVMVANGDRPPAVVDTRNLLDPTAVRAAGLGYEGVGRVAS